MDIQQAHQIALQFAKGAVIVPPSTGSEPVVCGFSYIKSGYKGNTKIGRSLKTIGFEKSYGRGNIMYNPVKLNTQSVVLHEQAADVYVAKFKELTGLDYIFSRSELL